MKKSLLLILLFVSSNLFAQTGSISGTVTDDLTDEALVGVTVSSGATGLVSDDAGNYIFTLPAGNQTIKFSFVGYNTFEKQVSIKVGDTIKLNVVLVSNAQELGTIVVSSSRYEKKISEETISMEVIKPSFIENTNSVDMREAINKAPGVNIIDGQANIRGGSGYSYGAGSRVLVLVDDVPQLAADAGDVKWDFLPLENLDQVEIIKGAASSLYGSSALNGIINIRTSYPTSVPKTQINFYQGIYQNPKRKELVWWGNKQPYYSGGYFSHSQKFGQLDLCFGGNIYNESSFREGEYTERGRVNISTRYRFKKVDGLAIGLNINSFISHTGSFFIWQDDTTGGYRPQGGTDSATTTLTENNNTRISIDPYITYFNKNGNRHSFHGRYYSTDAVASENKGTNAQLFYGEYQYQHFFKIGLNLTAGAVANSSLIASQLYSNHKANNEALFLQLDQKKGRFNIVGGIRYEMFSVDSFTSHSPVLVRAGINFRAMKATYFRASFGQGYRFPTIAEKFVATEVGPLKIFPNPVVNPEKGWSAEIGVKQGFKASSWLGYIDLCGFISEYKDFMEFTFGFHPPYPYHFGDPINGADFGKYLGFKTINITNARISGGEFSVIGQGKLFGLPTNLLAGITYIVPIDMNKIALVDSLLMEIKEQTTIDPNYATKETIDSISKLKILDYRYQWTAKIEFDISYKQLSTGFSFRYNSFMDNIDPIFNGTDPYIPFPVIAGIIPYRQEHNKGDFVIDYRISLKVNKYVKLSLITKNLLNREYTERPALIEQPRNFSLQISAKF